jgi:hypothetical protein
LIERDLTEINARSTLSFLLARALVLVASYFRAFQKNARPPFHHRRSRCRGKQERWCAFAGYRLHINAVHIESMCNFIK